jgi:hypothetical protein
MAPLLQRLVVPCRWPPPRRAPRTSTPPCASDLQSLLLCCSQRMMPPSGTPKQHLVMLLSNLCPPATDEHLRTATSIVEAGTASPRPPHPPRTAGDSVEGVSKPSGGGLCVFCKIVVGTSLAFKVRSRPLVPTGWHMPNVLDRVRRACSSSRSFPS